MNKLQKCLGARKQRADNLLCLRASSEGREWRAKVSRLRDTLNSQESVSFKFARSSYILGSLLTPETLRRRVRPYLQDYKARRRQRLYFEAPLGPVRLDVRMWPEDCPFVSVVVPNYNYGHYLVDALSSLLGQTFQNFEVIIVDCSDDPATIEILRAITDPRVRLYFRAARCMVGDNRNFGIERARGKYVCTFDPDDMLHPTYLEKALYILETQACQIVSPSVQVFGESDETWILSQMPQLPELLVGNCISVVALFDKEFWSRAGGYHDYGVGPNHVHEDWDFWVRMMAIGARVRNIPELLMFYRKHSSNMSGSKEIQPLNLQREAIAKFNAKHLTPLSLRRSAVAQSMECEVGNGHQNLISSQRRMVPLGRSVLFVLPYLVVGGAGKRFLELAYSLLSAGWRVTIVTTENFDLRQIDTTSDFEKVTNEIFHLPRFLEERCWYQFVTYLMQSRKVEVVLLGGSSWFYNQLPSFCESFPNVRVIDQQFNTSVHFEANRRLASQIDHTIAENEQVYRILRDEHKEALEKISLLYNGINLRGLRRELQQRDLLGLPEDKIIVSYIGRLSPEKGPDIFLDIVELLRNNSKLFFILAGPGPLDENLRAELQHRGLMQRVSMPGHVDVQKYLSLTDILVVPSRLDGRPNIVLEAAAHGVPIVASRIGGLPGTVRDGETGFLCAVDDLSSFVNRISEIAEDSELRTRLGNAARIFAETTLDSTSYLERYHRLFAGESIESDREIHWA